MDQELDLIVVNKISRISLGDIVWQDVARTRGINLSDQNHINLQKQVKTFSFEVMDAARLYYQLLARQEAPSSWLREVSLAIATLAQSSRVMTADSTAEAGSAAGTALGERPSHFDLFRVPGGNGHRAKTPELVGGAPGLGRTTIGDPTVSTSWDPDRAPLETFGPGRLAGAVEELPLPHPAIQGQAVGLRPFVEALGRGVLLYPRINWSGAFDFVPLDAEVAAVTDPAFYLVDQFLVECEPGEVEERQIVGGVSLVTGETGYMDLRGWTEDPSAAHVLDFMSPYAAERLRRILRYQMQQPHMSVGDNLAAELGGGAGFEVNLHFSEVDDLAEVASARDVFLTAIEGSLAADVASANQARAQWLATFSNAPPKATERARNVVNANLRRTLTYELHEKQQEYLVRVSHKGSKIGFYNGRLCSWTDSSASRDTAAFVSGLVDAGAEADRIAAILDEMLEAGGGARKEDAQSLVLRCNHVRLEPEVGRNDALDAYGLAIQASDMGLRHAAAEQAESLADGLEQIADGKERAAAYAAALKEDSPLRIALAPDQPLA